ncbi:hypothetical protein B0T26DRAFT_867726 [Lasiosphaeria miniovina]|uniref:BTB domain-containing protein n=1 Tax=Lasiosphaeria miniovina TaxID=1954250 RepID=A0AA40BIK0_9PEZI|nr:uncharacterized protein B0T26DRAFT_867726 [Lasiosphaeria miniovina]KAK0734738.1 hypothetical protein B0T26DRAFT_867726 [Lasiosphaeria miniovina]
MASNGHAAHGHAVANIARAGDTVLVVGPDAEHMIVSSAVLSAASLKTKALVDAGFAEQLPGPINGLVAVRLPHDQPGVVKAVLYALHSRVEFARHPFAAAELVFVARTADKFRLQPALAATGITAAWLQNCLSAAGPAEPAPVFALAVAACLLNDADTFAVACRRLVFEHGGSYVPLARPYLGQELDAARVMAVAMALEETRGKLRLELAGTLATAADYHRLDMELCSCGWYVLGAKGGLAGSGLAVSDISSSALGRCVEAADKVCSDSLQQHCHGAHQYPHVGNMVRERLKFLMKREDGSPCLWCVYQGEPHHMHPGEGERFEKVTNWLREELGRIARV